MIVYYVELLVSQTTGFLFSLGSLWPLFQLYTLVWGLLVTWPTCSSYAVWLTVLADL